MKAIWWLGVLYNPGGQEGSLILLLFCSEKVLLFSERQWAFLSNWLDWFTAHFCLKLIPFVYTCGCLLRKHSYRKCSGQVSQHLPSEIGTVHSAQQKEKNELQIDRNSGWRMELVVKVYEILHRGAGEMLWDSKGLLCFTKC